jgi:List-Bact-rpt repeat protein
MKIIARLYVLSFVILSICGTTISGFAQDAVEVTSGSAIRITASDAGLVSFKNKPLVFMLYKEGEGVSGYNGLTVITPASMFQGEGVPEILCRFPDKTPAGACEIWLTPLHWPNPLKPIRIHDHVMVKTPEITDVLRCPGPDERDVYVLKGSFFGMNPEVSVFFDQDGNTRSIPCRYVPPLPFPDALGRPESGCMDPFFGNSQVKVMPDEALPVDVDLWMELKSHTGKTTVQLKRKLRSDVMLKLQVEPSDLGSSSPVPGEYLIALGQPFEISALPIHNDPQKGYFNGWRLEGNGSVLEVPDGTAFVTLEGDATVTAAFSLQPEITLQAEPLEGGTVESELTGGNAPPLNKAFGISAGPAKGFRFSHWETDAHIRINDSFEADTRFWLTNPRNAAITAHFILNSEEVFFRGLQTVAACTATDETSGETLSTAWLSWREASCMGTQPEQMTYHIYMGPTEDTNDLRRPENLLMSVTGATSALIPIPEETGIHYFLVQAETQNGAVSALLPALPAKQSRLTLRRTPKVLTDIVSTPIEYSYSKMTFEGDYSDRFEADDFLVYQDMNTGQLRLGKISIVYSDGSLTILAVKEAALDQVIRDGELNLTVSWPCLNDLPDVNHSFHNTLYPGIDFFYGIRFQPTLIINADFDPDGLKTLKTRLTGPLDISGELRFALDQPLENSGNHLMPLTTRHGAFDLLSGMLPIRETNGFTLYGGITFSAKEPLHMTAPIDLETDISSTTTWSRNNGWEFTGDSTSPVHTLTCEMDTINDAKWDFYLNPEFTAGMFTKQFLLSKSTLQFSVQMEPEQGSFKEFERFDVYHAHSIGSKSWFRPFKDDSGNSLFHYENPFPGERIFSLPEICAFGGGDVIVSHECKLSPCLVDGINNLICDGTDCNFSWRMEPSEYQDDMTVYPPYYNDLRRFWVQEVVFVPKRLRSYTFTVKVKGNGFLGDLGIREESGTIKAILPPTP